jgi:hypothetical protein
MSWWNRLPYPIKAAIARFVRAVAAGGFSATATISIVGLEPKAHAGVGNCYLHGGRTPNGADMHAATRARRAGDRQRQLGRGVASARKRRPVRPCFKRAPSSTPRATSRRPAAASGGGRGRRATASRRSVEAAVELYAEAIRNASRSARPPSTPTSPTAWRPSTSAPASLLMRFVASSSSASSRSEAARDRGLGVAPGSASSRPSTSGRGRSTDGDRPPPPAQPVRDRAERLDANSERAELDRERDAAYADVGAFARHARIQTPRARGRVREGRLGLAAAAARALGVTRSSSSSRPASSASAGSRRSTRSGSRSAGPGQTVLLIRRARTTPRSSSRRSPSSTSACRPGAGRRRQRPLDPVPGLGSEIEALPATENVGRSRTATARDPRRARPPAVRPEDLPRDQGRAEKGQILSISSANGQGALHSQLYLAAKAGTNGWKAVFIPFRPTPTARRRAGASGSGPSSSSCPTPSSPRSTRRTTSRRSSRPAARLPRRGPHPPADPRGRRRRARADDLRRAGRRQGRTSSAPTSARASRRRTGARARPSSSAIRASRSRSSAAAGRPTSSRRSSIASPAATRPRRRRRTASRSSSASSATTTATPSSWRSSRCTRAPRRTRSTGPATSASAGSRRTASRPVLVDQLEAALRTVGARAPRRGHGRPVLDVRLQRRRPARGPGGLPRRRRHRRRHRLAAPPARVRPRPRRAEGGDRAEAKAA